jgi:hypothetical protein
LTWGDPAKKFSRANIELGYFRRTKLQPPGTAKVFLSLSG